MLLQALSNQQKSNLCPYAIVNSLTEEELSYREPTSSWGVVGVGQCERSHRTRMRTKTVKLRSSWRDGLGAATAQGERVSASICFGD